MITLSHVSKQYIGIDSGKDKGIALWVKNIARLTSNRAAPVLAVRDVSFTVERGEVFGVYGANGAGKTTLIKLLSGLLCATAGMVEVDGATDYRRIKNAVSYISTNGWMGLEWQLTARENLLLYGNMFGLSGKTLRRRCDEALEAVGVAEAKDKYISQLSAGMRQKVTIARGLILDRPVIFYDEPSVSLDVPSARALRELVRTDAAQRGRTALIASHNPEDLAACGRILLLSRGEVLATGSFAELKKPLDGVQMVEVKYLDQQSVKISGKKSEFSFDALIDSLVAQNAPVHSIRPIEPTLQEIYEYYLARREGEELALV